MWESQNIFGFFQHPHDSQFIEYPSHHDSVGPSNLGRMRTESDSTLVSQDTSISNSTLQGSSVASGSAMSNYDEVGGAAGWSPCPSFSDATTHDHPYSSLFETGAEVEVIEEEDEDEG